MLDLPYVFQDPALLELALTHSSTGASEDNERLEFLGDAALDLVVAEELFRHHPDLPEGDLTELKASVVSRRALAEAARELALEGSVRVGAGMRGRTLPRSVLANVYEALAGAVFLDGGLEAARAFLHATLATALARVRLANSGPNPKQRLQHFCQREWGSLPDYAILESRGESHARAFRVEAVCDGESFPDAWGRTRKEAERWAAHEALLVLEDDGS